MTAPARMADTGYEKSGSSFASLAALHRLELNARSPADPSTKTPQAPRLI